MRRPPYRPGDRVHARLDTGTEIHSMPARVLSCQPRPDDGWTLYISYQGINQAASFTLAPDGRSDEVIRDEP